MATQLRRKASVSDPVFVEGLAFYRHFSSACTRKEDRFTVFAACQLFSDFGFDPQFVDSFCCFASAGLLFFSTFSHFNAILLLDR